MSYNEISRAYEVAEKFQAEKISELKKIYQRETSSSDDIHVVLTGRPYTILSDSMNSGIPSIFAKNKIKVFYQDAVEAEKNSLGQIKSLLQAFHWHYAAKAIETALYAAEHEGVYPVLVTSFKCSPDSFTVEYFKKIMDHYGKPYLILQLDEHDSSIGYETRIEAAIRAFRNHHRAGIGKSEIKLPPLSSGVSMDKSVFKNKTLLLPNWDNIACELLAANLRAEGIDARLLDETSEGIRKSMRLNTGQCIPLNIIAQGCEDYIEKNNLEHDKTVLWLFNASISCNIRMFPYLTKNLFDSSKNGMERVDVYLGDMVYLDMSFTVMLNAYFANFFGGMLRKIGCSIRPYEKIKGETDRVIAQSLKIFSEVMESRGDMEEAVTKSVDMFAAIDIVKTKRPKAAIFGDIYVRHNDVMNQDLIKVIEDNGGEAVITPQSELLKIIADPYINKWYHEGLYSHAATGVVVKRLVPVLEKKYMKIFSRIITETETALSDSPDNILAKFNTRLEHTGESMENILKLYSLASHNPDIALFIQTSPAFCCPSLVTQAMSGKIEELTGIPVVTIEYDGTGGLKNDAIIPYLKFPREKKITANLNIV